MASFVHFTSVSRVSVFVIICVFDKGNFHFLSIVEFPKSSLFENVIFLYGICFSYGA